MILIDGFPIDCAESESHDYDNEVTDHPVEKGVDISDHARARPIMVTLDGTVSDTPIGPVADLREDLDMPSDAAKAKLIQVRTDREPISLETSLGGYVNMVLERLSFPRSAEDGDSLRFVATFKQITVVTNERTVVRVRVPRAAGKVDRGNKATVPVTTTPAVRPVVDETKPPVRRVLTETGGSGSQVSPSGQRLTASGGSGSRYSPSGKVLTASGGSPRATPYRLAP